MLKLATTVTRGISRVRNGLGAAAPHILVIGGIVGITAATIWVCHSVKKTDETIEEPLKELENLKEQRKADIENDSNGETLITEKDYKKDLVKAYCKIGGKFVKLYGPPAALYILSVVSILGSHQMLYKRILAMGAMYKSLEEAYKAYRNNVIEEYGPDVDFKMRTGGKQVEIVDSETGETEKVYEITNMPSPYACLFDEFSKEYSKVPHENLDFLVIQQTRFNNEYQSGHVVFLNDVRYALGLKRLEKYIGIGWYRKAPDSDGFIDFGILNVLNNSPEAMERKNAFLCGAERSIVLDFNVDGYVGAYLDEEV